MIYHKNGNLLQHKGRYTQEFEYMFILSKGKPKTFNPIRDVKIKYPYHKMNTIRQKDGSLVKHVTTGYYNESGLKQRSNVWTYNVGWMKTTPDKVAYEQPSMFPELLAKDHIITWSNKGDYILDPFSGAGTTYKMAYLLGRKPIGIEVNPKSIYITKKRLLPYMEQKRL